MKTVPASSQFETNANPYSLRPACPLLTLACTYIAWHGIALLLSYVSSLYCKPACCTIPTYGVPPTSLQYLTPIIHAKHIINSSRPATPKTNKNKSHPPKLSPPRRRSRTQTCQKSPQFPPDTRPSSSPFPVALRIKLGPCANQARQGLSIRRLLFRMMWWVAGLDAAAPLLVRVRCY